MKQHTFRLLQCAYGFGVLLAAAPLAGAQTPSPAAAAPPAPAAPPPPPALSNEEASYLFGLTFGEQLRAIGITTEVVPASVDRGLKDGLQGKKSTPAERQQVQEFARSVMAAYGERNKAAAAEFLTKNGHEKGVKTTPSGLQYKVLVPGDAKAPAVVATDQVTVNYRGKLIDGTEFDSSYTRGVPATFPVTGVIKGWQEALVLMKPGAKFELYVPPELGYGANPRPGIPANSLLIFDVDMISAKAGSAPQAAAPPARKPPAPASSTPQ
ncbi:MAG: FKBP-type peptidyl-prolyl cis-trans isomerase [Steroidobacteraceae bacterium]